MAEIQAHFLREAKKKMYPLKQMYPARNEKLLLQTREKTDNESLLAIVVTRIC